MSNQIQNPKSKKVFVLGFGFWALFEIWILAFGFINQS